MAARRQWPGCPIGRARDRVTCWRVRCMAARRSIGFAGTDEIQLARARRQLTLAESKLAEALALLAQLEAAAANNG